MQTNTKGRIWRWLPWVVIPTVLVFLTISSLSCFFFSSRRRHTRFDCDWSSDVCSSDLRSFSKVAVCQYSGNIDSSVLADGDFRKTTALPKASVGQQAWVQFEFAKLRTDRKSVV